MSRARPPLQQLFETASPPAPAPGFRISSGTWVVVGVVLLGFFAAVAAWLHRHNLERKPLDFWGFDSHRVMRDAPTIRATLIRPDTTVLSQYTKGEEFWHDNLFMIVENRYVVEKRTDVHDRPEFRLVVTNEEELKEAEERKRAAEDAGVEYKEEVKPEHDDFDPEISLRRALRSTRSYDWQAYPWSQDPDWRYALTFAKVETTNKGTKHELTRTFTFTLVFDATCRWVTLQSVEKVTALEPGVQQQFKKFFLEVFPGSDAPAPAPTATGAPTGSPLATAGPKPASPPTTAGPVGSGLSLGPGTMVTTETKGPVTAAPLTPTTATEAPPLQLNTGNPLLQRGAGAAPVDVPKPKSPFELPPLKP